MNITEHEKGPMRFFAARTGAKDVVSIQGSVLGGAWMLGRDLEMVPRIATSLLDAGTTKHHKDFLRSALADRGANISFSPGGDRTYFSATCLPDDIDFVFKILAECLGESIFPAAEISLQKKRTLAELEEDQTNTRFLAAQEFFRQVYDKKHVNYAETIATTKAQTERVSRADALAYKKLLGKEGLVLAITGDIVPEQVLAKAERAFGALPAGTPEMTEKAINAKSAERKEVRVPVADKANIDVIMGAHVPLTYDSAEYLPFVTLTNLLGGRGLSTGHLMRTIRERDGLTYGIYAYPSGFTGRADGVLQIWATFSPATYEAAVAATMKEIKIFLTSGITEDALAAKKTELVGRYAVGLATSGGLANALHSIGIEGKPLSYIDEYPSLIRAITLADLTNAAALVPWEKFTIAAAGTFDAK